MHGRYLKRAELSQYHSCEPTPQESITYLCNLKFIATLGTVSPACPLIGLPGCAFRCWLQSFEKLNLPQKPKHALSTYRYNLTPWTQATITISQFPQLKTPIKQQLQVQHYALSRCSDTQPVVQNLAHLVRACAPECSALSCHAIQLNPWRQNPKVHHRIHNSPPTIPILSQVNPLHSPPPPANLPKVHFDPIYDLVLQVVSFLRALPHQNTVHVSPLSHACHMPRPPHSPWYSARKINPRPDYVTLTLEGKK
jgi:hypothetical protein